MNGTFYSLTTPRACDRWREAVPADFVFALKGSRYITHMKRLRNATRGLANFFASGVLRLGSRLGPILWQLPPNLKFEPKAARAFFESLPRRIAEAERLARRHDGRVTGRAALTAPDGRDRPIRYAVEARHASWMGPEAADLLRRQRVALVWAETGGTHPSTTEQTTDELAYVRLHGPHRIYEGRYPRRSLAAWARRTKAWARSGMPVFVYFDNDRDAAAPNDALALESMVAGKRAETSKGGAIQPARAPRPRPAHFAFRSGRGGA